jgi:DNA modification methylase
MEDRSKVEDVMNCGELVFSDSTQLYFRYFADGSITHPAKANIEFLHWLIRKYTAEGDVILDPFAGVGSTGFVAGLLKRKSVLVEIEPRYVKLISETFRKTPFHPKVILQGDSRNLRKGLKKIGLLPTINAVVTSPPYADMLKSVEMRDGGYSYQEGQLGRLALPKHLAEVEKVYRECYAILEKGQKMVLLVRNYIRKGSVVDYVYETFKVCQQVGFKLVDAVKLRLPKIRSELTDYYDKHPLTDQVLHEYALVFERV